MADEQEGTQVETTEAPPAGETPAGDNTPDATALQAELEQIRKALKAANSEAADRRKKLEAFEAAEQKRKEAEMSELEKAQAALSEMERKATEAQQAYQREKIESAVKFAAQALNFHKPEDAIALLDLSTLTLTDKGEVDGVDEALKALSKERSYLIKPAAGQGLSLIHI